jgi:hypothetical protein
LPFFGMALSLPWRSMSIETLCCCLRVIVATISI